MEYTISTNDPTEIKVGAKGIEDILQCVRTILGTIEGSVPLDRRFGISSDAIDEPLNRMDRIYEEIYRKVETYEPRVNITSIKVKTDNAEGKANIIVGVRINEEYL